MRVSNVDKISQDHERAVRLCNYSDVYYNERINADMPFMRATASSDEIARFRLQVGDVLITKDSEAWNDIGVPAYVESSADDLVSGYHLALLRPDPAQLSGAYLSRVLSSSGVANQLYVRANGVTRYGLSHDAILSLWLPAPPLAEQAAVVRFLDHADDRIQRYIRTRKKLIALLEEQKQAIIHQTVTGQIDVRTGERYPAYKDSGVEWLQEVPAHWLVVRNGRLFAQRGEVRHSELPILEVSIRSGVTVRKFEPSDRKQIMSDREMYKRAAKGDIAYNMMRMWQGAVGVVPIDGLVSPAYVVARPVTGVEPRFFSYLFRTNSYMTEINKWSRGIVKDRNRLYWEGFKKMSTLCPPLCEQTLIADAIEAKTKLANDGIDLEQRKISLMRDYWTRLVADVVTGKLDVREAARALPEGPRVQVTAPDPLEGSDFGP